MTLTVSEYAIDVDAESVVIIRRCIRVYRLAMLPAKPLKVGDMHLCIWVVVVTVLSVMLRHICAVAVALLVPI
jgi:hypothetical protein